MRPVGEEVLEQADDKEQRDEHKSAAAGVAPVAPELPAPTKSDAPAKQDAPDFASGTCAKSVGPALNDATAGDSETRKAEDFSASNEQQEFHELLIRVPFEIDLRATATVRELRSLVAATLQEAELHPTRDVFELLLGISGQAVESPEVQPFQMLVPGSVVSLVEESPEAAEVASVGLCLNAKQLHMMQAQSQILRGSQAAATVFPVQPPLPAPPVPPDQASMNSVDPLSQAMHSAKNVADLRAQVQREQRERFYKTRICMNYAQGLCTYGPRCTFAHGDKELRQRTQGVTPGIAAVAPADAPQVGLNGSAAGVAAVSGAWDVAASSGGNWDNAEKWSSWKNNRKVDEWNDWKAPGATPSWRGSGEWRDDNDWYQNSGSGKWSQELDDDLENYWRSGGSGTGKSASSDTWRPQGEMSDNWGSSGGAWELEPEDCVSKVNGGKDPSDRRGDRGDGREGDLRNHRDADGRSRGHSAFRSVRSPHRGRPPPPRERRDDSSDSCPAGARGSKRKDNSWEGDMRIQDSRRSSGHTDMRPTQHGRPPPPRERMSHRDAVPPPPRPDSDDETSSSEDVEEECERSRSDRRSGDLGHRSSRLGVSRHDREAFALASGRYPERRHAEAGERHATARSHRSSVAHGGSHSHERTSSNRAVMGSRSEGSHRRSTGHTGRSPPPPAKRHRR